MSASLGHSQGHPLHQIQPLIPRFQVAKTSSPDDFMFISEKSNSTDYSSDDQGSKPRMTDEMKYKTEMCKNFQATGSCNYGKKCRFAHGKMDLVTKPLQTTKPYKTKTCKAFHEDLTCPYGSRCHFKHDERSVSAILANKFFERKLTLVAELQARNSNSISSSSVATTSSSTTTSPDQISIKAAAFYHHHQSATPASTSRLPVFMKFQ